LKHGWQRGPSQGTLLGKVPRALHVASYGWGAPAPPPTPRGARGVLVATAPGSAGADGFSRGHHRGGDRARARPGPHRPDLTAGAAMLAVTAYALAETTEAAVPHLTVVQRVQLLRRNGAVEYVQSYSMKDLLK